VIRYANGETLIATCTDSAFFTRVDYFPIARNPSRVDAKHEDHFLQADLSLPISFCSKERRQRLGGEALPRPKPRRITASGNRSGPLAENHWRSKS
jgi:hypothetical protein